MLNLQRASLESFSSYSPISDARIIGRLPRQSNGVQIIPVGEERLNVATRTVQGETTRIRRRVVAQPVEQQVTLREEKVIVERRAPTGASSKPDVLTETVIEMSDSRQVPTVWKSLHVAEEVVLRKQVTERTEKVRETVRRDVVDVEHAREAVPVLAYEVERGAEVRPAGHETEVERQKEAQPSDGQPRQHDEPQENKRQQDELHDKKAGQGPQGPAPQAGVRKS
ncbi:MAG: YsnF/AvaK domain-containing protein [Acetobacteraceae bacterium]|nr:YsnF/AvaK domain-containing protein [Acetobacteraceae bacterium]